MSEVRPGDSAFLRRATPQAGPGPRWAERLRLWGRGGIRARVGMAMLAALACVAPAFGAGLYFFGQMQLMLIELARVDAPLAYIGERIVSEILFARREEKNFLLFGSESYLERQRQALAEIDRLLAEGAALGPPWETRFAEARRLFEEYRREAVALGDPGEVPPAARAAHLERLRVSGDALASAGRALADEGWRRTAEARDRSLRYSERAQGYLLVLLAATAALTLFLVVRLPQRLVHPLRRQIHALQQAAQGNYNVGPLPRPGDEVGELSLAIERLLGSVGAFDVLKSSRIRESETKFRLLAERTPLPVAWVDTDLVIRFHNRAFAEAAGALAEGARIGGAFGPEEFETVLRLLLRDRDPGSLPIVEPVSPAATAARYRVSAETVRAQGGEPSGLLLLLEKAERAP